MAGTAEAERLLTDQRARFYVDDDVAYFNTASMSPLLRSVREAGDAALERRSKPWTISPQDWFTDVEALRSQLAGLIGSTPDDVAFVPATSYGLGVVARNLRAAPGQRVLVLDDEFPSNYYTWDRFARETGAELRVVGRRLEQTWTEAILAAIDERVAIVSVPNVHWTNGALVDLEKVAAAVRDIGASFVVDASQSLGVMPLDVGALRPDALVAVGYKWLLGPHTLSYLYLDQSLHDGEPLEENWVARAGSDDFSSLMSYRDEYAPGARRFDMGQRSSFQLVPMAAAGIAQVLEWGIPRIAATLKMVTDEIAARAGDLGAASPAPDARAPHMLGLDLPPGTAHTLAAALAEANVIASVRGSSLRISPHLHVNRNDVDRLLEALTSAL